MNLFSRHCYIIAILPLVEGLGLGAMPHKHRSNNVDAPKVDAPSTRRSILQQATLGIAAAAVPFIHNTNVANSADAQFVEVGQQEKPPNGETPFSTLENGVQVKDFRVGGGGASVQNGSKVELTMKGRLLNLNGVSSSDHKCICWHQLI